MPKPNQYKWKCSTKTKNGSSKAGVRGQLEGMAINKAWCGNWAIFHYFYVYITPKVLKVRTAEGATEWQKEKQPSLRTPQVPTAGSVFEANQISISAFYPAGASGTGRHQGAPELSCTPGPTGYLGQRQLWPRREVSLKNTGEAASTSHLQGSAMGKEKSMGLFTKMAGQHSLCMGFARQNLLCKGLS